MKKSLSALRHLTIALFVLSVLILGVSSQAQADLTLTLFDGTTTVSVADGSGLDGNNLVGVVTYSGSLGVWELNVTTGISTSTGGAYMDLNSVNGTGVTGLTSNAAGTLTITLTDSLFAVPSTGYELQLGGTLNNGVGNSIALSVYNDSVQLINSGVITDGVYGYTGAGTTSSSAPSAMSIVAVITHADAGTTSFDANIHPAPIPAAVWLLGSGLVGLVGIRRRSKKQAC